MYVALSQKRYSSVITPSSFQRPTPAGGLELAYTSKPMGCNRIKEGSKKHRGLVGLNAMLLP